MVYDIINTIVWFALALLFCSVFLKREECSNVKLGVIGVVWVFSIIVISNTFKDSLIVKLAIVFLIQTLFLMLIYKGNKMLKIIAVAFMFYVLSFGCEVCVVALNKYIDPELQISEISDSNISIVYMGVVSQLVQAFVVFLIRTLFRKVKTAEIASKLWLIYTVFPVYSLSLVVLLVYCFDGPTSLFQTNVFTYIAVSLLLINLFIFWFIKQESKRVLEAQKNEMEIAHAQGIVQLYDQITRERDILGKREHEFKNTISALQGLIADKQYDKMKEILDAQKTELINNTNVFETGNRLINTILNTKFAEAREKDITFRFVINDLSHLKIEDRDCIVILSNILNNAIEAAEKCPEENRHISVKAIIEDGQFIFSCRNTFIMSDQDPDMKSRKKDIISHGYGIDNVKEAVNRNNGTCFFEKQEDEYVAVIIIPLKDTKFA